MHSESCSKLILNQSFNKIKIGFGCKNIHKVFGANHSLFVQSNMAANCKNQTERKTRKKTFETSENF